MSTSRSADLIGLFVSGLAASAVVPGETVGVYSEGGVRRDYAEAFVIAAEQLGATAFAVDVPPPPTGPPGSHVRTSGLATRPALVDAFKGCDLMVDLALLLFLPEKIAIQEGGTRILTCVEPVETIKRLFPEPTYREEARAGERRLRTAQRLVVRSPGGTDVTYELGELSPMCQYGQADEPGRWDHFASAFVATAAGERAVNGQVVLDVGDVVLPSIQYVREPITLTIEGGHVVGVSGGVDAFLVRDQMERHGEDGRAVSHVGWGLHAGARWDALRVDPKQVGLDARSFRGCVMFSTGPNTEFGGSNTSSCHFDMPMRNCSLWVDDDLVVEAGSVVTGFEAVPEDGGS